MTVEEPRQQIIKRLIRDYFAQRPPLATLLDSAAAEMRRYEQVEERISQERAGVVSKNRLYKRKQAEQEAALGNSEDMLLRAIAEDGFRDKRRDAGETLDDGEWEVATGGSTRASLKRLYLHESDDDLLNDNESKDEIREQKVQSKKQRVQIKKQRVHPQLYKSRRVQDDSRRSEVSLRHAYEQDRVRLAQLLSPSSAINSSTSHSSTSHSSAIQSSTSYSSATQSPATHSSIPSSNGEPEKKARKAK